MNYSKDQLCAIYELGKMYFEMGFFVPSERIFSGLATIDNNMTAARLGLGLLKLERGLYQEATLHFRTTLQAGAFPLQAKLGMVAAFIGMGELPRAQSMMAEVAKDLQQSPPLDADVRTLVQSLSLRCAG